jgi:hypothetical protein
MNTLKSAGAVVAGLITVAGLSTATDFALAAVGVFPSIVSGTFTPWMYCVAVAYRIAFCILGGYVTAKLAPRWPMRHVIVLGIIGTIAGVAGIVAGVSLGHVWYPVAVAVTGFPAVWFGGYLFTKKMSAQVAN